MLESSPAGPLIFESQVLSVSAAPTALTVRDSSSLGFPLQPQLSSVLKNPHVTQQQWKQLGV